MSSPPNLHFTPYWRSPLVDAAEYLIAHATQLPDLTDTRVIIAEPGAAALLRRALLDAAASKGLRALLGPQVLPFDEWLAQYQPTDQRVCTQQSRLLILVEALFDKPELLGQANAWTLADSLLDLFDELTLNHVKLSHEVADFTRHLAEWYAIKQIDLNGLQHEARLVHGLWQAWHTQLQATQLTDPATAHVLALQHSLEVLTSAGTLHFIGIEPQQRAQADWLHAALRHTNVHVWWHGRVNAAQTAVRADAALLGLCAQLGVEPARVERSDAYQDSLARLFAEDAPLRQRAERLHAAHTKSVLHGRIAVFSAHNAEQEAHAIDVQCRQWLLEGKQQIAIITENRRLARRVRALLERAGILLQDAAGWALSTTRAAATIEALLICIEDDFPKDALLDLCKSPYLFPELDRDQLKSLIYRLEHDIIRNEGISSGLGNYLEAIRDRAERLRDLWNVPASSVSDLLQRLGDACQPLSTLLQRRQQKHKLADFLTALQRVLAHTGLSVSLQQDAAGILILQGIDEMESAVRTHQFSRYWRDFRAWLGRNLEKSYFRPGPSRSPVELLSLAQSQLQHFDAIILAAAEQEYLPGSPARSPFFNDGVRAQLGLATRAQFQQQRLRQFYRLLHSAPAILISHRAEQDGEPVTPSPWLAALVSFHQLAYHDDLQATQLHALLHSGQTQVKRWDSDALPARQHQPQPALPPGLTPHTISASDYQRLLDCPYQFFAARCLQLSPPEEVSQVLSKREYGERVHLCLQAFHSDVAYLPGPFTQTVRETNKPEAIALLQQIAEVVFRKDLKDNYLHRGWYHQWLETIPVYIDWQIARNQTLQVAMTEHQSESALNAQVSVKGRLDRIDQGEQGYAIIDYKSGATPKKYEIESGEKIQLPFYALLAQSEGMPVTQVEYLNIGKAKDLKSVFPQRGEALQQLTADISERLQQLMQQIQDGSGLPAWEHKESCKYCDMSSLCRVGGWEETS
jgi:ATP-dependent helicase/nuclease subunit B